jgi:hypothetical protein
MKEREVPLGMTQNAVQQCIEKRIHQSKSRIRTIMLGRREVNPFFVDDHKHWWVYRLFDVKEAKYKGISQRDRSAALLTYPGHSGNLIHSQFAPVPKA